MQHNHMDYIAIEAAKVKRFLIEDGSLEIEYHKDKTWILLYAPGNVSGATDNDLHFSQIANIAPELWNEPWFTLVPMKKCYIDYDAMPRRDGETDMSQLEYLLRDIYYMGYHLVDTCKRAIEK